MISDEAPSIKTAVDLANKHWDGMWSVGYDGAGYKAEMQARPPFVARDKDPAMALLKALHLALTISREEQE